MLFKLFLWGIIFGEPNFNIFLFTFERLLISMLFASIILLCHYGYRDAIKKLTSSTSPINYIWISIDRLGLSLYIIHPGVIIAAVLIRKQPLTFDLLMTVS